MPSFRPVAACVLPALVIALAWASIEEPRRAGDALVVAAFALVPALFARTWLRAVATGVAAIGVWTAFGARPWELLPFRDERVLGPAAEQLDDGIEGFYRVILPFDPSQSPEMHSVVLVAIFGFVLAAALLAASGRPLGAAAVTIAGAGWPATLVGGAVAVGALALAAALSIPLVLRVRSGPALAAGVTAAAVLVGGAAWATTATAVAREPAVAWESWDFTGLPAPTTSVRFAWDSNYEGIRFPPSRTTVLTVQGPERPNYWRASTLDLFVQDHWFEDPTLLGPAAVDDGSLPLDSLTPRRALRFENWLEQRVQVKALVDDHLVAAGTPMAVDPRGLGAVLRWAGGVLTVRNPLVEGRRYRVWSYAPDPAPSALEASKPVYPRSTASYLRLGGRIFPTFALPSRESLVRTMFADPAYPDFAPYRRMYALARRVVGSPSTPYAAVLALESWFRRQGGFRYDELPPPSAGPPLVAFVTQTRAGYCQHFAGAMALMMRMLGIPARVAVGFTSGTRRDGAWVVTDHEAHAWVEVWFEGHGWVPFDPTPGRGTFSGTYSFASDSEEAVAALDRGELSGADVRPERLRPERVDLPVPDAAASDRRPSLLALGFGLGALWVLGVGLAKEIRRRLWYATRDPRRLATASRRELESFLRDQGVAVPASATHDDLRYAIRREFGLDGGGFVEAAASARFGPPEDARVSARASRRELRALLGGMRSELSRWSRLRGFVSLRSLRGGWVS